MLIETRVSFMSAETERMLVKFGRCSRNLVNTRILNSLSCDEIKEAG